MGLKVKRQIIQIDEDKCTGCGLCVPSCAEGAIQIVDGKAKLVSERYCDGLGACLGECPEGALTIIEREAEDFDEEAVKLHMAGSSAQEPKATSAHGTHAGHTPNGGNGGGKAAQGHAAGTQQASAHTGHSRGGHSPASHGPHAAHSCPGARMMQFKAQEAPASATGTGPRNSMLGQWPVQLMLVPVNAPYFQNADLLVAADCVPFALAGFHEELLKGKAIVVGCPKLDDINYYIQKLAEIISTSDVRSVTVAIMEVPCCSGLLQAVREAVEASGKVVPVYPVKVGIRGEIQERARLR